MPFTTPSTEPVIAPRPRRRWFQFSLRALLIVTSLCGGPLAYVAWEREQCRRGQNAIKAIDKLGGWVHIGAPQRPHWQDVILGNSLFRRVDSVGINNRNATVAGLVHLARMPNLEILYLDQPRFSDDELAMVRVALPNCKIVQPD